MVKLFFKTYLLMRVIPLFFLSQSCSYFVFYYPLQPVPISQHLLCEQIASLEISPEFISAVDPYCIKF